MRLEIPRFSRFLPSDDLGGAFAQIQGGLIGTARPGLHGGQGGSDSAPAARNSSLDTLNKIYRPRRCRRSTPVYLSIRAFN
jgi:hypothetical protein